MAQTAPTAIPTITFTSDGTPLLPDVDLETVSPGAVKTLLSEFAAKSFGENVVIDDFLMLSPL